jgi:hypothetical protein
MTSLPETLVPNPFFKIADVVRKDGEVAQTVDCKICGERLYDIGSPDAKEKWRAIPGHFKGHDITVVVYP